MRRIVPLLVTGILLSASAVAWMGPASDAPGRDPNAKGNLGQSVGGCAKCALSRGQVAEAQRICYGRGETLDQSSPTGCKIVAKPNEAPVVQPGNKAVAVPAK